MKNRRVANAPAMIPAVVVFGALVASVMSSGAAAAGTALAIAAPCHARVLNGRLPRWARGGFYPPTRRMPHVLGRSGQIVAILWADPLLSPPPATSTNKILWVSRTSLPVFRPINLRISAQRMKGSRRVGSPVRRTVKGGPGPSIINLPAAGCWRFSLHWGRRTDVLDLQYQARTRS
jgi:hypothetical protein